MQRILTAWAIAVCAVGCANDPPPADTARASAGSEEPAADPASPRDGTSSDAAETTPSAPASPDPPGPPAPVEPVNLLRAVRTDLAVSSAYRDQLRQVRRLVDGDLESAWNSRTGDLQGAWIEVRLPADVEVTSVALTAGFTHTTDRADLFVGNHRVSRVRVLRDGELLSEHALDVESRELQTLPVQGAGGVYRIEVLETQPGSNRRWRELCVSELRVMGRAPNATPGLRYPRVGRGALPEPRVEPGSTARAEVAQRFRQGVQRFAEGWASYERARMRISEEQDMGSEVAPSEWDALELRRRQLLRSEAELVGLVDETLSDRLRYSALGGGSPSDLDLVAEGFAAMAEWLDEDEARCRWARRHAHLRLERVTAMVGTLAYGAGRSAEMDGGSVGQADRLDRLREQLEEITGMWERDTRGAVRRLRRFQLPEGSDVTRGDYSALEGQLTVMESTCWQ